MDRFNIPQSTIDFISQFQKQLKGLVFIHKFLQSYKNLTVLDLTDNILGNRGALEIKTLI
jgi:Ran GTPase-activating protein (RanGAP) involved in mRNA processing and transport